MGKDYNIANIAHDFNELLEFPSYINELEQYKKDKTLKFAQSLLSRAKKDATEFYYANKNKPQYKGKSISDYQIEFVDYHKANKVIDIINGEYKTKQPDLKKYNELSINGKLENLQNDMIDLCTRINPNNKEVYMFEEDVIHFINQNFKAAKGVAKFKTFKPNMNKSELRQTYWLLYNRYCLSKQKSIWLEAFNVNFPSYKTDISNLKDYCLNYLKLSS